MPFQLGNKLGRSNKKARIWEQALVRAIKAREATDPQALEKLADKLLKAVDSGDVHAMRELADRLDGKSIQAIEVSHFNELPENEINEMIAAKLAMLKEQNAECSDHPTIN